MLYFSIENARTRVHKDLAIIDDGSVQIKRQLSQHNPSGRTSGEKFRSPTRETSSRQSNRKPTHNSHRFHPRR